MQVRLYLHLNLEIRHDPSTGTRLILWRSILREGKPLLKITLNDFRWTEEDSKEVLMRDQKYRFANN